MNIKVTNSNQGGRSYRKDMMTKMILVIYIVGCKEISQRAYTDQLVFQFTMLLTLYLQIKESHADPVQLFILLLNCLLLLADFLVSSSVFQYTLSLHFSELFPYLAVLIFGG